MTLTPAPDDERVHTRAGRNRKADLLAHAERLFAERGFAHTRMIDIAEAAGVTKGNLYWYFENKEDLAREIAIGARERLRLAQADAIVGVTDPLEILYRGVRASVRFNVEESPIFSGVIGANDAGNLQALAESSQVHNADASLVIVAGQEAGLIHDDEDPNDLAHAIQGIVNHASTVILSVGLAGAELDRAVATCARLVLRLVAAEPSLVDRVVSVVDAESTD